MITQTLKHKAGYQIIMIRFVPHSAIGFTFQDVLSVPIHNNLLLKMKTVAEKNHMVWKDAQN